jgi:hypothetical protein
VAGFFASTLKNREYGINGSGVAVVGVARAPQIHYYAGVEYYLWRRDLFPGALKGGDYWKPGVIFGYGLDESNNFIVGPNWETKIGVNLGAGVHIGQEAFLPAGISAGAQVPSGTTTITPANRLRIGAYGNIGFDFNLFKTIFSNLLGGGSSPSNGNTPSTQGGGAPKKGS